MDSRLGFIDEGIFRRDVIVANLLTRMTLMMELDCIGATSIESITRLQRGYMTEVLDESFQIRVLLDCFLELTLPHDFQVIPPGNEVRFSGLGVGVDLVIGYIPVGV